MKKIFVGVFLILSLHSRGQIIFQKLVGETRAMAGYSFIFGADGSYIVSGVTQMDSSFAYAPSVTKFDLNGDIIWNKRYYSGGFDEWGEYIEATSDNGFILVGGTRFVNPYINDAFNLIKIDSVGNHLWTKYYSISGLERGISVKATFDGGYILSGWTSDSITFKDDLFLVKTDSIRNLIWSKTYGGVNHESVGHVYQVNDGGYLIAGYSDFYGVINNDFILIKTDSSGNITWNKTYGGLNFEECDALIQCSDGNYIMAGSTSSYGYGSGDILVIKVDSSGNEIWS